jgi:hypothetical protein
MGDLTMKLLISYDGEVEDFRKSVGGIQPAQVESDNNDKITALENEIKNLKMVSSAMRRELIELRKMLLTQQLTAIEEKEKVEKPEGLNFRGLTFSKSIEKEFKYTELDSGTFQFKYVSKRNQNIHSAWTVFDVQIIKFLETENTWETWTDISRMINLRMPQIQKIAYNIKCGFFDKFDYSNLLSFSKEYGLLYINGMKTNVSIKTVKYIVNCMLNSNNPFTTLLKLKKSGECSDLMYKVIGTNYKNKQLTGLLNDFRQVPIENNPEKRKEMGI